MFSNDFKYVITSLTFVNIAAKMGRYEAVDQTNEMFSSITQL